MVGAMIPPYASSRFRSALAFSFALDLQVLPLDTTGDNELKIYRQFACFFVAAFIEEYVKTFGPPSFHIAKDKSHFKSCFVSLLESASLV